MKKAWLLVLLVIAISVVVADDSFNWVRNPIRTSIINSTFGSMFFHEDGLVDVNLVFDVDTNVSPMNNTYTNQFSFNGDYLEAQESGLYAVDWSISFSSSMANKEVSGAIGLWQAGGLSEEVLNQTHGHRKLGTANDIGNMGATGVIDVQVGDRITLTMRSETAGGAFNAQLMAANLKIVKLEVFGSVAGGSGLAGLWNDTGVFIQPTAGVSQDILVGDANASNVTVDDTLRINPPGCTVLATNSKGHVICANATYASISITTTANTFLSSTVKNPFNSTQYAGAVTYQNNSQATGIRYNTTVGRFLVNITGQYYLEFYTPIIGNADEFDFIILRNGVIEWQFDYFVHSAVDQVYRAVAEQIDLIKGDEIEIRVQDVPGDGADAFQLLDGTTINIHTLTGTQAEIITVDNSQTANNFITGNRVYAELDYDDTDKNIFVTTDNLYPLVVGNATGITNLTIECQGYIAGTSIATWRIEIHGALHNVMETTFTTIWDPSAEISVYDPWVIRARVDGTPGDATTYHLDVNEVNGAATMAPGNCQLIGIYGG